MPTIDIDRDAAREAAQEELAKPIYPKGSWTERLSEWLDDLLFRLAQESSRVPGGWLTIGVLLVLSLIAVVVATRVASRTLRTNRGDVALFDGQELGAAEHRATAERHAALGEWEPAIRHRLRAAARHLEETGVLHPAPGRTATELGRDAGRVLPQLTDDLASATTVFNDVTYGGRPGSEAAYRVVADLDDRLRSSASRRMPGPPGRASGGQWAEVR